ncbi:MAG: hypothetical protein FJW66_06095 [Actinobacteria bacterium]|nr:hypothetical protein [Actinomycetota bacterium]
MNNDKKIDRTIVYYVLGGAAVGAIAGYIVKKVGMKNIVNVLKAKKILPEGLMDTISEFTDKSRDDDLEEDSND